MFWEWFWDLYEISFGFVQPCPNCYLWSSSSCGYLDEYMGEYDCIAPDLDGLDTCDGCHHLICGKCKEQK